LDVGLYPGLQLRERTCLAAVRFRGAVLPPTGGATADVDAGARRFRRGVRADLGAGWRQPGPQDQYCHCDPG